MRSCQRFFALDFILFWISYLLCVIRNMEKICSACKEKKNINNFHLAKGVPLSRCKCCINKANKEWYNKNKHKKIEYNRQWAENNKDLARAYKRKYYYKNSDKMNETSTAWRKRNKDKHVKNVVRSTKKRYKNDLLFRLAHLIRRNVQRVTNAIKKDKELCSLEYLGCSLEEFKLHIESLWLEGMCWDNHGEWHIDHKIPLSWFIKNSDDPWKANHYLNLQPLWAEDNLQKGSSI